MGSHTMKETLLGKLITHLPKSGKRWAICAVLAAGSMAATWLADQVAFFQLLGLEERRRIESEAGRFTLIFLGEIGRAQV